MGIGKDIADAVVALMLDELKRPAFSVTLNSVKRSRLPAIQKKELPSGEAVVRVSFRREGGGRTGSKLRVLNLPNRGFSFGVCPGRDGGR